MDIGYKMRRTKKTGYEQEIKRMRQLTENESCTVVISVFLSNPLLFESSLIHVYLIIKMSSALTFQCRIRYRKVWFWPKVEDCMGMGYRDHHMAKKCIKMILPVFMYIFSIVMQIITIVPPNKFLKKFYNVEQQLF